MAINDEPKPNTPGQGREGNEKLDLRVLAAEDGETNRKLLRRILGEQVSLEFALDGTLLVKKLSDPNYPCDLIITDFNMPGLNGLEAMTWVRAMEHRKDTPFIMISAELNFQPIKEKVEAMGGVFMQKPYNIPELLKKIKELKQEKR